jgi:hypothetical protein
MIDISLFDLDYLYHEADNIMDCFESENYQVQIYYKPKYYLCDIRIITPNGTGIGNLSWINKELYFENIFINDNIEKLHKNNIFNLDKFYSKNLTAEVTKAEIGEILTTLFKSNDKTTNVKQDIPCKQCGRNVFESDDSCWWCCCLNPGLH